MKIKKKIRFFNHYEFLIIMAEVTNDFEKESIEVKTL